METKQMKRILTLVLIICLMLASCGKNNSAYTKQNTSLTEETTEPRAYNDNMTMEQYAKITSDLVKYAVVAGDSFKKLSDLCEKYSDEINSAEIFNWSQYWDFRELKTDISSECEKLLQYDDSECSPEYQLCIDELKNVAYKILHYFAMVSEERDVKELDVLTSNIRYEVENGMNLATVYQTKATIAYMEENNMDADTIQELKKSIDNYSADNIAYPVNSGIFKNLYGSSKTKCVHKNCNNVIASSGDTDCCIVHSNKCLNCKKYIDEDAWFCMDCLIASAAINNDSGRYSGNSELSDKCRYKYFDGTICGRNTNNGSVLCDKHFKELNDTYNNIIGR